MLMSADSSGKVERIVRLILQKISKEDFETSSDVIIILADVPEGDTRTLIQIIDLIIEKAVEDSLFGQTLARLCLKMAQHISPNPKDDRMDDRKGNSIMGSQLLRRCLQQRCHVKLETVWGLLNATSPSEGPNLGKNLTGPAPQGPGGVNESADGPTCRMMWFNLVCFMGELCKLSLLSDHVGHQVIKVPLTNNVDSEMPKLVCLVEFLATLGSRQDGAEPEQYLDHYLSGIHTFSQSPEMLWWLKHELMDLVSFRQKHWSKNIVNPSDASNITSSPRDLIQASNSAATSQISTRSATLASIPSFKATENHQISVSEASMLKSHMPCRPEPLNLSNNTKLMSAKLSSTPPSPIAIVNLSTIHYPPGIKSPEVMHNQGNTKGGKFRYDRDFLLQFMSVCKHKPDSLPPLDALGIEKEGRAARTPQTSNTGAPIGPPGLLGNRNPFRSDGVISAYLIGGTGNFSTGSRELSLPSASSSKAGFGAMKNASNPPVPIVRMPNQSGSKDTRLTSPPKNQLTKKQQRRADDQIKGLLSRLKSEEFGSISDQIVAYANKSENERDGRTLIRVIGLILEGAIEEDETWIYARLCHVMSEKISQNVQDDEVRNAEGGHITGKLLFRKYLLNRCQEDFEQCWSIQDNTTTMTKKQRKQAATKAKGQQLRLVKFLGEPFKLSMLTERVMHECIKAFLSNVAHPEDEDMVGLCNLLNVVGQSLDNVKAKGHMDIFFSRIKELSKNARLRSQTRNMLQDLIELRHKKWLHQSTSMAPDTPSLEIRPVDCVTKEEVVYLPSVVMSKERAEAKVANGINDYFSHKSINKADKYFQDLPEEHRYLLVYTLSTRAFEGKEADVKLLSLLFSWLSVTSRCSSESFQKGLLPTIEQLDVIAIDMPHAYISMARLLKCAHLSPSTVESLSAKVIVDGQPLVLPKDTLLKEFKKLMAM